MFSTPSVVGYPALFGLVLAECAGVPLPGETALLAAGVLAGAGRLDLPLVVLVAMAAAVLGDTLGYWLGRRGGRSVLLHRGPMRRGRVHAVERGERYFARHGAKTVFLGRFVPGVRVVTAAVAGATEMPWPRFALYNALGAFAWAATVGGLASLVGPAASSAFWVLATGVAVFAAT